MCSSDLTQVSATFPNKNVGAGKALVVTAANSALSGADAGNYNLTVGTGFVGQITPAPLTLVGFGSVTKVYDATVAAALGTGSVTLSGVISGDAVSANASAVTAYEACATLAAESASTGTWAELCPSGRSRTCETDGNDRLQIGRAHV